jgi:hypothetical protein
VNGSHPGTASKTPDTGAAFLWDWLTTNGSVLFYATNTTYHWPIFSSAIAGNKEKTADWIYRTALKRISLVLTPDKEEDKRK